MRLILFVVGIFFISCKNKVEPYVYYHNHNDTVKYVGIESCMSCHYDIYQTYVETGMGKSLKAALPQNSQALFHSNSLLTDSFSGYSYFPYWQDSVLYLKEMYEAHERVEDVDYIIGSGHHTNSHLWQENGYVHQMPFTFYTQEGYLNLPPGYENGNNSRFSRAIGLECMSCHNAMPDFVMGSENKYNHVPHGIDCERCHGPGELHVQRMLSGEIVDTSKHIDYSIVNPKKLSLEAQFQICMRCHLQGNTVLSQGKSFFDFKPGMELSEIMTVFVPRFQDDNTFIMASHVDRLKQSECFNNSEMNCITCHNPHHSVQKTQPNFFNNKCLSCHSDCTDQHVMNSENKDCVSCHMPTSGTLDIPHVTIHDHKIAVHNNKGDSISTKGQFIGLKAVNNSNPSKLIRAKAYLYQFEKFDGLNYYLDSAQIILNNIDLNTSFKERIHLYYLKKDFNSVVNTVKSFDNILQRLNQPSYTNEDAWTAYRIAFAYEKLQSPNAIDFYLRATELAPYVIDFRLKLADFYSSKDNYTMAEKEYRFILSEFSKNEQAWCNLGFILFKKGELDDALSCYNEALSLNPKHIQTLTNMASLYLFQGNIKEGKLYLEQIIELDPKNNKINELMGRL
ncbi:MAG: tetratricopeptide repeat protein [Flavobacteriales bacterium]